MVLIVTSNNPNSLINNNQMLPATVNNIRPFIMIRKCGLVVVITLMMIVINGNNNYQVEAFYNTNDPEGFDDYILNNLQMAGGLESNLMMDVNSLPFERTPFQSLPQSSSGHLSARSGSPIGSVVTMKRSCIRRSGICDARPSDCCLNSVCRCNLWGANCRCQRMGLFQRLGRKK